MTFTEAFIEEIEKIAKSSSIHKGRLKYKDFKKNKVQLEPEERALVMKRRAVWNFHHGRDGKKQATPAVGKAVIKGKPVYETHTHRAINYAPTLKGAISRYHKFIKGTA